MKSGSRSTFFHTIKKKKTKINQLAWQGLRNQYKNYVRLLNLLETKI